MLTDRNDLLCQAEDGIRDLVRSRGLGDVYKRQRMMSGNSNLHEQLEEELAAFEGKEDAALLNYGYQGMVSIIDVLCGRHDVIVYDAESHACIIDGLRLHPGHRYVYKHNDMDDLSLIHISEPTRPY